MSTRARMALFALGATAMAALLIVAALRIPSFGTDIHPYRDATVALAQRQHTPNVVSSINFDQRGLDTLGEEAILVAAVVGAATLLRGPGRPAKARRSARVLTATRMTGYLLLPVTLMIGADVVVHGHLTPGGGFQGGVVLATGLHLLYVAGDYDALRRIRPLAWYEFGEASGLGAVVALGAAGSVTGAGFLANTLPLGRTGQLASAGTVPLFSTAVGVAVGSGVVVLLAQFLDQYVSSEKGSP
ncbi:sodium:proton antiporter [Nocardia terpenica]|uniref:MnhB domain-containing protein n=1 Tax=Nocardia terpenica TaxID=455432 RepID=UPI00189334F3|nr:MnhB domain-containing protein [Nocardia terpenica]MBF6060036.1 sodium:proton antiporter [Nocardia terpenica]MBF6102423.1 sodium:proton antiporter [Nocardia terpenica]MBF6111386.1 sodium:proton antiporter [Nocardia terpenica]MBF6117517.1 sodium:proton antiporter [Nocardia terpenica]MBF6150642.1 sodium:proton antiporter [Nocardia terpenica]